MTIRNITKSTGGGERTMKSLIALLALSLAGNAGATDYPHYRGDGSGAPPDTKLTLIAAAKDAKLVWSSEVPAPELGREDPFQGGRYGSSGFGIPVLAEGRVYLGYWQPAGPKVLAGPGADRHCGKLPAQFDADEIVICLDAANGKTLWQTVFPGHGWNYPAISAHDGQITTCVAAGKVLMLGATGWAYCLDAKTGDKLWEQRTGKMATVWESYKVDVLSGKCPPGKGVAEGYQNLTAKPPANPEHGGSGGGGFNSTPRIFGEVAVFNLMGRETVAFDLATGKERWRKGGKNREYLMTSSTCPVAWRHNGKDYLICYSGGGCVDPVTGELLWTIPEKLGGKYQGNTPSISGDILVATTADPSGGKDTGIAAYRLSSKGAERLWQRDDVRIAYMSPVIHRGHAYLHTAGKTDGGNDVGGQCVLQVDLLTGDTTGIASVPNENSQGGGPFVMDDRLIVFGGHLFDIAPDPKKNLPALGLLPTRAARCTIPSGADGRIYIRPRVPGGKNAADGDYARCLVQCFLPRGDEGGRGLHPLACRGLRDASSADRRKGLCRLEPRMRRDDARRDA
jgi:outer membrane protein assembly factor BamB